MSPQSPGPAEMPQNKKARSWSELKQAANGCFKTGQYGEAVLIYSRAIGQLEKSSKCVHSSTTFFFHPVQVTLCR